MLAGNIPALFGGVVGVLQPAVPATGNDANTLALLHFDFPDLLRDDAVAGRLWTIVGPGPGIAGGKINYCAGFNANTFLNTYDMTGFNPAGDYTVDCWMWSSASQNCGIVGLWPGGTPYASWMLYQVGSNVCLYASSAPNTWDIANAVVIGAVVGVWAHIAVVKQGTTYRLFYNGNLITSFTSALVPQTPTIALVGIMNTDSVYYNGYLDELRISNVARWTANFTPMTQNYYPALPAGGNDIATKLLMHFNGNVIDVAAGAAYGPARSSIPWRHVFTNGPGVGWGNAGAGVPGRCLTMSAVANSRLACATPNDFDFGRGNFTIDFWYYRSANSAGAYLLGKQNLAADFDPFLFYDRNGSGTLAFFGSYTGSAWDVNFDIGTVPLATWTHLAVVRNGAILQSYINGTAGGSKNVGINPLLAVANNLSIGGVQDIASSAFSIEELRISNIARWTAPFTRPSLPYSPDAPDRSVRILLHFDGPDGSTLIRDSSGNAVHTTWTAANNAQLDNGIAPKFGSAALLLTGGNDCVYIADTPDVTLGIDDFTVDCWFNRAGGDGTYRTIAGQCDASATPTSVSCLMRLNNVNKIEATVNSGSTVYTVTGTTAFTSPGWHHAAFVRFGAVLKLFVDGIQEGGNVAIPSDYAVNDSSASFTVGKPGDYNGQPWIGSLDELRLLVGTAAWTSNFTPPTAQYPDPSNGVVVFSTPGAGVWTVPSNWPNGNNSIEVIGGGAGGSASIWNVIVGRGGGGGAYSKITNLALTPGAVINFNVGSGGGSGVNGGDTWFNGTSRTAASVSAQGGITDFGSGGLAANGIGTVKYNGGSGGNSAGNGAGGGGAAAGSRGPGGNGGNGSNGCYGGGGGGGNVGGAGANAPNATAGGGGNQGPYGAGAGAGSTTPGLAGGDASDGGGGGGSAGQNGASNTNRGGFGGNGGEWRYFGVQAGAGGGGGGAGGGSVGTTASYGGYGGGYGGGGGGGGYGGAPGAGGLGAQGIIVIRYG